MRGLRRLVFSVLLAVALVGVPHVGVAAPGYDISGEPSMQLPTETITYEGMNYTVQSVTRVTENHSFTVQTSVPDGASYKINFRGPENELISSEQKTGDASHTISYFGTGRAGSYAATINDEGSTQSVQPVVLQGYDIAVSAPASVEQGETVTIRATVEERPIETHSSFDYVQLVIGLDDRDIQTQMTETGDGQYSTTVSTVDLETKEYGVYVGVRGAERVRERAEILAVSDRASLAVTPPSGSAGNSDDQGATPSQMSSPDGTRPSATPTRSSTDESDIIQPSTPSPSPRTTDGTGTGFTSLVGIVTLLCISLWYRRVGEDDTS